MAPRDEIEAIRKMIVEETKWLRHYLGQVASTDDELKVGRVLVKVPELGWSQDSVGAWCRPRDKHGLVVPAVGEWVEVYFICGDPNRPVYLGNASEIQGQVPAAFDGKQTTAVLFQDPATKDSVVYDGNAKKLTATFGQDSLVWDVQNRKLDINVNGNVIEATTGKVTINGNLEVDQ